MVSIMMNDCNDIVVKTTESPAVEDRNGCESSSKRIMNSETEDKKIESPEETDLLSCPQCTYQNAANRTFCEMCFARLPKRKKKTFVDTILFTSTTSPVKAKYIYFKLIEKRIGSLFLLFVQSIIFRAY